MIMAPKKGKIFEKIKKKTNFLSKFAKFDKKTKFLLKNCHYLLKKAGKIFILCLLLV